ncbi:MAG: hypothetical protein IKZ61_04390 [Prevotella sp.]|nr:hypothetical protein [Prevotella sp.]
MIVIESKRKKSATIYNKYPNAILADVTSGAKDGLVKFSPFYPHGGIPVPFSEGYTATCVEAVWQGLKVFKGHDVDISLFQNDTMKGIKRTARRFGKPLGHRKGVHGKELLSYIEARKQIYIPTYKWVLENKVVDIIERLREASKAKTIVLLDYDTNDDVENVKKPLSHASLIKAYVEGIYPYGDKMESKAKETRKRHNIVEQDLFNQIEEVDYGKEK